MSHCLKQEPSSPAGTGATGVASVFPVISHVLSDVSHLVMGEHRLEKRIE